MNYKDLYAYDEYDEEKGNIHIVISVKDILDTYYFWWSSKMLMLNRSPLITEQNCVEDHVTIHWAYKVHDYLIYNVD